MKMLSIATLMSASLIAIAASAASAAELQPMEAQHVSLGPVSGIVYFTEHGPRDQLVATLGAGDTLPPVRFETGLLAGQSAVISVPREAGTAAIRIRFERRGDRILVIQDPMS